MWNMDIVGILIVNIIFSGSTFIPITTVKILISNSSINIYQ